VTIFHTSTSQKNRLTDTQTGERTYDNCRSNIALYTASCGKKGGRNHQAIPS